MSRSLGTLMAVTGIKEYNCRSSECDEKIIPGQRHAMLLGKTKKKKFFGRRFHFECLVSYMNWFIENQNPANRRGRVMSMKLSLEEKKQRDSLLRLVAYDKAKMVKIFRTHEFTDKQVHDGFALLLLHIKKIRSFGEYKLKLPIEVYSIAQAYFPDLPIPRDTDYKHEKDNWTKLMLDSFEKKYGEDVDNWLKEELWMSDAGDIKMLPSPIE